MNLEQQVCSLALSQRLRELGVKQESLFCHAQLEVYKRDGGEWTVEYEKALRGKTIWTSEPAFTVAELGEMLPEYSLSGRVEDIYMAECTYDIPKQSRIAVTEADARAKMLIYLIENKLITV